ncbi:ABC transporter substrate-binding protein [Bordetella holmesii]|uniref:NMT1/THI5-like protein n=2 Tax=Bordetella holmesii TaxID=35814 RepID=A0A158M4S2_9BORD|nr:ABC transporter substrate-binding protein [Bordetella holmesii]AHV92281.1 NMT1-like family protein [Bordetella holmesii ATCC 51541]AIT25593.1 NMT1-like family protein [Bordetella holmesii 44057]EWM43206.1 NMT1-like family protein [Bordetella holmesii 41130]EWM46160.1 NMT1-like family protein [Bordetella holmesii 35009]EWM50316.1 NMT1-like family protein [Bordetella holmesii 70147]
MLRKLFATALLAAGLGSAAQAAQPALEIGYLPILPDAQLFVALESGSLAADGVTQPKLVQFQSGPALTQALIAGQLDAAYVGIGPALVARAKGADIKVVASNIVEQVGVLALGPLAPYFASGDPSTAFARFAKEKGRKAVIASYPKGAVPEAALQYWLRNVLKADLADIDFVYQGEAQIQQSLMTGAIDGAAVLEPTTTSVLRRQPDARVVARGSQLFPKQPGAVLLVRETLIKNHPEIVQALVRSQIAATAMLRDDPAKAAGYVQKFVGGGRLPLDLVEAAIRNSRDQFEADPRAIEAATAQLQDFQAQLGTQAERVDIGQLFDTRFYVNAKWTPA